MCGRFLIDSDDMPEELVELINHAELLVQRTDSAFRLPRGEIRPGDCAAVIARSRSLTPASFAMRWGFRLEKQLLINARSESAAQKPTFRQSMRERRCLIPVSAYFEWDHRVKPFQKYHFASSGARIMYLAGLYRFEADSPLPAFTILTREAAPDISCFHDRMPVIIPAALTNRWLDHSQPPEEVLSAAETKLIWQQT